MLRQRTIDAARMLPCCACTLSCETPRGSRVFVCFHMFCTAKHTKTTHAPHMFHMSGWLESHRHRHRPTSEVQNLFRIELPILGVLISCQQKDEMEQKEAEKLSKSKKEVGTTSSFPERRRARCAWLDAVVPRGRGVLSISVHANNKQCTSTS